MRMSFAVAGIALLLGAGAALAETSAWEMVWRSETATTRVSVVGRVRTTDVTGERAAVARVWAADGKLRLDYELGRHRWSLIDDGRNLIYLDPLRRLATVHPRSALAVDRSLAERNYQAQVRGEAEIAGRPTQLIEIASRRGGPAVLRLWLDREWGLALKRERYNVDGQLASGTAYEEIEFGAHVNPDIFLVPEGWGSVRPPGEGPRLKVPELSKAVGFLVREPAHMPQGYVLLGGHLQEWGQWGLRMAELRYTDGLRLLSVFQREDGREGPMLRREGRRHGRGREHRPGRGLGRGRGRAEGRGGGGGFGPPGGEVMTLVDRGTEKALRYLGSKRVVVVVGDLTEEEIVRVARDVH